MEKRLGPRSCFKRVFAFVIGEQIPFDCRRERYSAVHGGGKSHCWSGYTVRILPDSFQFDVFEITADFNLLISCTRRIDGKKGSMWIWLTNDVDVNFSNPNSRTTEI